ncbi:Carboxylesterase, type B [Penicillium camemberti]|uniref:Carboxylesterase, type B n=1 Tax=Penicillium camemberti (strain FM 013) TaxID=1429867 RepID=A0A0G4PIQ1_PENC3|nr:Carboxylesterase, type B [Penicillium camemberti]
MLLFTLELGLLGAALCHLTTASPLTAIQYANPTAIVKNGTYTGRYNAEYDQDFFLGIPYAQPPVGDLRLRNPVSLNTSWDGSADATTFASACYNIGAPQFPEIPYAEDCLNLNVVRPSGVKSGDKLPVGVWIHGGGHTTGSNQDPNYNMTFLVQQSVAAGKPFIGVNIQYRMQLFGFMFGSAIVDSGIQENIAAFSGDPSMVTIWGESAGAESTGAQLIAYGGQDQGLFRGVMLQSGGPINPYRYNTPKEWDIYYRNILRATNCSRSADTLACLRTVPVESLFAVFNSSVATSIPSWGMEIDGDFIRENAREALVAGRFIKVPVLHGQNNDEATIFSITGVNTNEDFYAQVRERTSDNATVRGIAALYPDIPAIGIPSTLEGRPSAALGFQYKRISAFITDLIWHAPRRLTSQILAQHNVPNWNYLFNVRPNGMPLSAGAAHFTEVSFMFYNILGLGYADSPFANTPASYKELSNIMSRYWVNFIVDGDPNGSGVTNQSHWPSYSLSNPQQMTFDANTTELSFPTPDTYRAAPIQYIINHLGCSFGR